MGNVVRFKPESAACAILPASFVRPAYRGPPFGRGQDGAGARWLFGPRAPWGAVFRPPAAASGVLRFCECGGLRLAHRTHSHPPGSWDAAGEGFPARVLLFRVPSGRRALRPRGHCACPALIASLRVLVLRFGALRVLVFVPSPCPAAAHLRPAAIAAPRLRFLRAARALGAATRPPALNYVKVILTKSAGILGHFGQFLP